MNFTPYGQPADQIEKVMLLSMWASYLNHHSNHSSSKMILAGLGKPTYPIHRHMIKAHKEYWENLETIAAKWYVNPEQGSEACAIGYGDPYGDYQARSMMATAMSHWYHAEVNAENILFTVGGIGGLRIIFDALNGLYAKENRYRVITPFPHYSAYSNNRQHLLHPINVLAESGLQLTAKALEKSIVQAYFLAENDHIYPKAVLICNPSNPLGTVIKEDELKKIAAVLRLYPELLIIFDEAYAEMSFKEIPSLLTIAPDLRSRIIMLRSATKALSAAGERMAVIIAFDDVMINELVKQQIISYIHPPRSSQIAYAQTMLNFSHRDRQAMSKFYQVKVDYVFQRLYEMGAALSCPNYRVEATFYVLGDFSDLMGLEIPPEVEKATGTRGLVQTGEDLAYYLLFNDALMVTPLSYFGLAEDCGLLRITCSAKQDELKEMMDRLEKRLIQARLLKNELLVSEIALELASLDGRHALKEQTTKSVLNIQSLTNSCAGLKLKNNLLAQLLTKLDQDIVGDCAKFEDII